MVATALLAISLLANARPSFTRPPGLRPLSSHPNSFPPLQSERSRGYTQRAFEGGCEPPIHESRREFLATAISLFAAIQSPLIASRSSRDSRSHGLDSVSMLEPELPGGLATSLGDDWLVSGARVVSNVRPGGRGEWGGVATRLRPYVRRMEGDILLFGERGFG
eukprot:543326-Amorphochlora_amoeboformis.AAC.1